VVQQEEIVVTGDAMKKRIFWCTLGLMEVIFVACNTFSGVLYPKVRFSITSVVDLPDNADMRLEFGDRYPQTFSFDFSQAGNTFEKYFVPTIFTKRNYRSLNIKTMEYEYENIHGIFLQDRYFILPENDYIEKNGWYWRRGVGGVFFSKNLEKIFKNKKPGDVFMLKILLTYSFDEGEEVTQLLEYNVHVVKGEYISPFMGR